MSDQVELRYPGVENAIHVPPHRVDAYKARGWKRVTTKKTSVDNPSTEEPGKGTTNKEE